MQYVQFLRTSLSLNEICEQIVDRTEWKDIQILGNKAFLQSETIEIKFEQTAINPNRETFLNLKTSFIERAPDGSGLRLEEWQKILRTFETHTAVRLIDHYYLYSKISLKKFCSAIQEELNLDSFEFDSENENEWAIAESDDLILNVSRAYRKDTFHEWNPKDCPPGCNYSLEFTVKETETGSKRWSQSQFRERWLLRWKEFFANDLSCISITHRWNSPIRF
ncbi:hypothetical protein EHQ76_19255 [Leptospira barantonii]|uniref:Uncharacterized protein n=1 Tax=Leptospira barantonii TaxID=2023184 RepID=A0A5F2AXS7_9LEPT|nr:hypothetical protein [Leptospira barantonii]TGL92939.1 hypothetical protein EHQ76_19255 [Leptospira barantonii]